MPRHLNSTYQHQSSAWAANGTARDNVVTPVAVVAPHASQKAKPIRVLTNVNLEEREQLLELGFSVQMMDTASVRGPSGDGP